jgi:PAS domain S-box-containing protein
VDSPDRDAADLARANELLQQKIEEHERAEQALRDAAARYRAVVETAVDAIITIDERGAVESLNPAAERLFGYPAAELVGKNISLLMPEPYRSEHDGYLANYLRTGENKVIGIGREVVGLRRDGSTFPMELAVSEVPLGGRRLFTGIVRDISERKRAEERMQASLREKEVLLKEVHHRVKNNLQVVSSLLNLGARAIRDPAALAVFEESQARVQAMALIHEKLYRAADFTRIDFAEYARSLAAELLAGYRVPSDAVRLTTSGAGVFLTVETAIPCALILNELVSNSLKHAFPGGRRGDIRVDLRDARGEFLLTVADNGVGMPEGFDVRGAASLGLRLVRTLAGQLGGTVEHSGGGGTTFVLRFPVEAGRR